MNKNATLIIVGAAALLIGVAVGFLIFGPGRPVANPPAKYVLMFGTSTSSSRVTVDLDAFHEALNSAAPNWSTLEEVDSEGATPTPVPVPSPVDAPAGTVLVSRVAITQDRHDNGPCTMHVTQKVGLNDPVQVRKVVAALKPETTPWPPPR